MTRARGSARPRSAITARPRDRRNTAVLAERALAARPRRRALVAMLFLLALAQLAVVAPGARADTVALPNGWTLHTRVAPSGAEDLACGRDVAYARDWFGSVARWDGAAWTTLPRRSDAMYGRSLAVTPDGQLFMEASGRIAQWDGSSWIDHALPTWEGDVDAQLAASSASDVYYVGRGRIARFDGRAFATYDGGTWRDLHAVALAGDDLLVGGQGGTILRHRAGAWTREPTAIATPVRRVLAFAPGDVWAWADGPDWQSTILLHHDGRTWTRRDTGLTAHITSIGGLSDRVFVTGDFGLMRWDATRSAWVPELLASDLGPGQHQLEGICATDRHVVIADRGGHALTHPR